MGTITYTIPTNGTLNSTADPQVATALTTIQTLVNGNIDTNNLSPTAAIADTQLSAPVSAVRKLLFQASAIFPAGTTNGTYLLCPSGAALLSGASSSTTLPVCFAADSGLTNGAANQPLDFPVAGRTAYGRLRLTAQTNTVSPALTGFTTSLYPVTVAGTAGALSVTAGAAVAGSTLTLLTLNASSNVGIETSQFAMPTSAGVYAIGVSPGGTVAANSILSVTAQLYGYNA